MGSFNMRCGLSGLPIMSGMEVVTMVIAPNDLRDTSPCYPFTNWGPVTLLANGAYNDYGSVELSDEEFEKFNVSNGQQHHYWPMGAKQAATYVTFKIDREMERFKEPFGIWMAHKSIWLQYGGLNVGHFRYSHLTIDEMLVQYKQELIDLARTSPHRFQQKLSGGESLYGLGMMMASHPMFGYTWYHNHKEDEYPLSDEQIAGLGPMLDTYLELYRVHLVMDALNMAMSPLAYAGQDDYSDTCIKAARINIAKAEEIKKRWDEDPDYDDSDDERPMAEVAKDMGFESVIEYASHEAKVAAGF